MDCAKSKSASASSGSFTGSVKKKQDDTRIRDILVQTSYRWWTHCSGNEQEDEGYRDALHLKSIYYLISLIRTIQLGHGLLDSLYPPMHRWMWRAPRLISALTLTTVLSPASSITSLRAYLSRMALLAFFLFFFVRFNAALPVLNK